jgi:hypothetical protein
MSYTVVNWPSWTRHTIVRDYVERKNMVLADKTFETPSPTDEKVLPLLSDRENSQEVLELENIFKVFLENIEDVEVLELKNGISLTDSTESGVNIVFTKHKHNHLLSNVLVELLKKTSTISEKCGSEESTGEEGDIGLGRADEFRRRWLLSLGFTSFKNNVSIISSGMPEWINKHQLAIREIKKNEAKCESEPVTHLRCSDGKNIRVRGVISPSLLKCLCESKCKVQNDEVPTEYFVVFSFSNSSMIGPFEIEVDSWSKEACSYSCKYLPNVKPPPVQRKVARSVTYLNRIRAYSRDGR